MLELTTDFYIVIFINLFLLSKPSPPYLLPL